MTNQELAGLIEDLLAKTKRGEVPWALPSDFLATLYPDYVTVQLPHSSIAVRREQLLGQAVEAISFSIRNEKGDTIVQYKAAKNAPVWQPLNEILTIALRRSRKVDETLKDVQEFLKKKPGG